MCVIRGGLQRQGGQALVMASVTVLLVVLVMLAMYSVGQQSIAKIKLQNTADAAAYSAAVAQARDLNFAAYTNRAMVANQVAVAQFVGMTSWARNYKDTYHGGFTWMPDLLMSLGPSYGARITWKVPWTVHGATSSGVGRAFDPLLGKGSVVLLDGLIEVLAHAQLVYHYGTVLTVAQTLGFNIFGENGLLDKIIGETFGFGDDLDDLMGLNDGNSIIKANDPNAQLSAPGYVAVAVGIYKWMRFFERKDPATFGKDGEKADRFAKVALASLDGFSRDRSTRNGWYGGAPEVFYLPPVPWVVDPSVWIPYQSGAFTMWLWHRGGTEIKAIRNRKKSWSAMDVTGFSGVGVLWIPIPILFVVIPIPIPIPLIFMPMGGGAASAGADGDLNTSNIVRMDGKDPYGGVYESPNTAAGAGIQRGRRAASLHSTGGFTKYLDVKDIAPDKLARVAPGLIVEVEKSAGHIPSSNQFSGGQLTLTPGTRSNDMRALSKAEVYFSRPAKLPWSMRDDGKMEHGSLYNPYWQPRLVANGFADRYWSMTYHLQ